MVRWMCRAQRGERGKVAEDDVEDWVFALGLGIWEW